MRYLLSANRKRCGYTVSGLAREIGITYAAMYRLESGDADGKVETWKRIQEVLFIPDADMWDAMRNVDFNTVRTVRAAASLAHKATKKRR